MITLTKHPDNILIAKLVKGKKSTPVWWHPTEQEHLRNAVTDLTSFDTERFRDRFELTGEQSRDIFGGIKQNTVVEHHQSKFFLVKRHIRDRLLQEMDVSDTTQQFVVDFDENLEHSGHLLAVSSTGGGKTFFCGQMVIRNLDGPKALRRHFLVISAEWHGDKSLAALKHDKYREYVTGVDVSEDSLKNSQFSSAQEFFDNEVKIRCENLPRGAVVLFDDNMDSCCPSQLRVLINRMLRVSRHQGVSIMVILHSIRSGTWSSQAYNSIRWLVLFPRAQRNKIIQYLNKDIGMPLQEARRVIREFAQVSRTMIVRIQAPECLIGSQLIKLL